MKEKGKKAKGENGACEKKPRGEKTPGKKRTGGFGAAGVLQVLIMLILGGAVGAAIGRFTGETAEQSGLPVIAGLVICLFSLALSLYVHIVLHEGGHLVCGLLSGYRFVSFRVGSFIWVRQGEKIVLKKFSIPGTGGQCLLDPPELDEDGTMPCLLYNLGGGLSNLLFAALAGAVICFAGSGGAAGVLKAALVPFAAVGIYLSVMNLTPLKVGGVANDGYNIRSFRKNKDGARALWLQLRINRLQQTDGMRLAEIPDAYFEIPGAQAAAEPAEPAEGAEPVKPVEAAVPAGDPLIDALQVFGFQRLLDQKRFEEAARLGRRLADDSRMLELYRNTVRVELLYLELIGACRGEEVEKLYDKTLRKYLKMIRSYPSAHRVLYALAQLYEKDEKAAARELAAFEKALKTYPVSGEIVSERELMEQISEKIREEKSDEGLLLS